LALDGKCGGKLAFAKWSYPNTLVWAQIESREASESLDGIPAVEGLTGVTGRRMPPSHRLAARS